MERCVFWAMPNYVKLKGILSMTQICNAKGPQLTVDVSEREQNVAKNTKEEFKKILSEFNDALKLVFELRDALVQEHPDQNTLKNYQGRFLRYRRKIVQVFNKFLLHLKTALEDLESISDPDMLNLKQVIIAEVGELTDGIESLLELLGDLGREGFTQHLERLCTQFEQRKQSIREIIDNQLFDHIEHDILGKFKISEFKNRITKRARLYWRHY